MRPPEHPVPVATPRDLANGGSGYYRWPMDYRVADAHLDRVTGGSPAGELIRLIAGRSGDGTYSRTPDSLITLDGYSLGHDHQWSEYAPDRLAEVARASPAIVDWAWGSGAAGDLADPAYLRRILGVFRGKHTLAERDPARDPAYQWFAGGWWEVARHPAVLRVWLDGSLQKARATRSRIVDRGYGATDRRIALATRAANSYGVAGLWSRLDERLAQGLDLDAALVDLYWGAYGQPDRYQTIAARFGDRVSPASAWTVEALNLDATPVIRVDGSSPRWASASKSPYAPSPAPAPKSPYAPSPSPAPAPSGVALVLGSIAALIWWLRTRR